jgi:hypothetical protein
MGGDLLAEFCAVEHGEVGALPGERGHEVRRVAQKGDPGDVLPAMPGWQGVNAARHHRAVGVGEQRAQGPGPAPELVQDGLLRRLRAGEVDAVQPVLAGLERGVDVQAAVALAVAEESLAVAEADEETPADQDGARRVAGVGLQEVGFDEGDAGVCGPGPGDQGADT